MRRYLSALLACALALALYGCSIQEEDAAGVRVYCLETLAEGSSRLTYNRLALPEGATREERSALITAAVVKPESDRYFSALPEGMDPTLTHQGVVLRVDFDAGFETLAETEKSLAVAALCLSLLEQSDVSFIYISAGGKSQPPFYDQPISRSSFLTEEDTFR